MGRTYDSRTQRAIGLRVSDDPHYFYFVMKCLPAQTGVTTASVFRIANAVKNNKTFWLYFTSVTPLVELCYNFSLLPNLYHITGLLTYLTRGRSTASNSCKSIIQLDTERRYTLLLEKRYL